MSERQSQTFEVIVITVSIVILSLLSLIYQEQKKLTKTAEDFSTFIYENFED